MNERSAKTFIVTDQLHHMLHKTSMYLGSMKKEERSTLGFDGKKFITVTTSMPRGLERTVVEALENSFDAIRKARRNGESVEEPLYCCIKENTFTIRNSGDIPLVQEHPSGLGMLAKVLFFVPNSSDNFDSKINTNDYLDGTKNANVALKGRNGLGAKFMTILSKVFKATHQNNGLKYEIESQDNASTITYEKTTKTKSKDKFIEVTFTPDLKRFDSYKGFTVEDIMIFRGHLVAGAYCNDTSVRFEYKSVVEDYKGMDIYEFSNLVFKPEESLLEQPLVGYLWDSDVTPTVRKNKYLEYAEGELPTIEFALFLTPDVGKSVSFVNGSVSVNGGTHDDAVMHLVQSYLVKKLAVTAKRLNINVIKKHVSRIVSCNQKGEPDMDGNTKTKLMSPKYTIPLTDRIFKLLDKSKIIDVFQKELEQKLISSLIVAPKKQGYKVDIDGLVDANYASKSRKKRPDDEPVTLILVEGKSAAGVALKYTEHDRDHYGYYPLRGKIMRAYGTPKEKLLANKEISSIMEALGADPTVDYSISTNRKRLRYDRVGIMSDADPDGAHIDILAITLFDVLLPTLVRPCDQPPVLYLVVMPLIAFDYKKKRLTFYTMPTFHKWVRANPTARITPKYMKGIASYNVADLKKDMVATKIKELPIEYDEDTQERIRTFFGTGTQGMIDKRKWLDSYNESDDVEYNKTVPITFYVDNYVIQFTISSIIRGISSLDGFKQATRKLMTAGLLMWDWGAKDKSINLDSFAGYTKQSVVYPPDLSTLYDIAGRMTRNYAGSNNLAIFVSDSMFGDRGGEKDGQARYMSLKCAPWWPYMFPKYFQNVVKRIHDKGEDQEYERILSVVPLLLINGTKGIASCYGSRVLPNNPIDVIDHIIALVNGTKPKQLVPWFANYTGTVELVKTADLRKRDKIRKLSPTVEPESDENAKNGKLDIEPEDSTLSIIEENENDRSVYTAIITGVYNVVDGVIHISEIPPSHTVKSYRAFLKTLLKDNKISDFTENCVESIIDFKVYGMEKPTVYDLDLVNVIGMSVMNIAIGDRVIKHYNNNDEIALDWYKETLEVYRQVYEIELDKIDKAATLANQRAKLIRLCNDGSIVLVNKTKEEIQSSLDEHDIPFSVYEGIHLPSLIIEKAVKLEKEAKALTLEYNKLKKTTPNDMWLNDLVALRKNIQ